MFMLFNDMKATGFNIVLIVFFIAINLGCNPDKHQVDRSPQAEFQSFRLADPNLQITLVAAEPDVESPVAMMWAPDGSLYVAEMSGYPLTENTGRIKKLHDPDGDGYYQAASVFAKDLNFPNSLMWYNGGILVTDAPEIYFLKDTDADGVADLKEVVLSGFRPGNEQLRANGLYWGLDNWIYGANGRSGGSVYFAGDTVNKTSINSRDFRFRLDPPQFEAISGMSQFGIAHDDWGNRFITINHRFARQVVLEEKHLTRSPQLAKHTIYDTYQSEHDRRVYTLLEEAARFNRDPIGYFTSLSGLTAYRGNALGPDYYGDLFAGESVQSAVIHRRLKPDGPVFKAIDIAPGVEFLASPDSWFHPVNFSNGPDGALYMVDFYRMLVEHPQWAHDDRKEGVQWKLGEEYGRIWRIARKEFPHDSDVMNPKIDQVDARALVQHLKDSSGWKRDLAQQLLVNQQMQEAGSELEKLLSHQAPATRVQALWTLHGLGLLTDSHIEMALQDETPQVIAQAIGVAEDRLTTSTILSGMVSKLVMHQDQLVRYHAILSLSNSDSQDTRNALVSAASEYDDSWTRIALLSTVADWAGEFAVSLLAANADKLASDRDLSFYRQIGALVASNQAKTASSPIQIEMLSRSRVNRNQTALLAGYLETSVANGSNPPKFSSQTLKQLTDVAGDLNDPQQAMTAIELLGYSGSEEIYQQLAQMVLTTTSKDIKQAGIKTLSQLNDIAVSTKLFDQIQSFNTTQRQQLITSSLGSEAATSALLAAITSNSISASEVPEELRHALLAHTNDALKTRAEKVLKHAVNSDRQAVVDQYLASLNAQTVDLKQGAAIFNDHCSVCHAIAGSGGLLGPDLTTIGNRSDEILLVNILDPSRMVSYELRLHVVVTKSGEVYSGTISAETTTSITVRQPDGKEHTILRENIKENNATDQSIMPEGFERSIDENAMADLIGFLRQPIPISN